ncbi:MAG: hypothetical protein HC767_09070 [Akkermansiaceae bacterium]|nr:hypothetical protein [Akkermansiaceae bacterium]
MSHRVSCHPGWINAQKIWRWDRKPEIGCKAGCHNFHGQSRFLSIAETGELGDDLDERAVSSLALEARGFGAAAADERMKPYRCGSLQHRGPHRPQRAIRRTTE